MLVAQGIQTKAKIRWMSIYEGWLNHRSKQSIPYFGDKNKPVKHLLVRCFSGDKNANSLSWWVRWVFLPEKMFGQRMPPSQTTSMPTSAISTNASGIQLRQRLSSGTYTMEILGCSGSSATLVIRSAIARLRKNRWALRANYG